MRPSMFMGGSGLPPALFVGTASQYVAGEGWVALNLAGIAGLQVGDYVLAFTISGPGASYGVINPASGWSVDNYRWTPGYGYPSTVFHRRLVSLTAPSIYMYGPSGVVLVAYRGASRAARKVISYEDDGNSIHVVPGFVRQNDCVGVVCQIWDRDVGGTDFTVSSGWTRRIMAAPFVEAAIADSLPRNAYVDGAPMTWGGLGVDGPYAEVAMMYELRI
jgi:hypothetical protein